LINQTKYNNSTLSSFGFSFSNQESKLTVSEIYENMEDLKVGDQILSMDGTNYKELIPEQWCEIVENGLLKDKEEISITILRNNKEFTFSLKEMKLI
jgi:C-terminal processing protease CtpA/Prc